MRYIPLIFTIIIISCSHKKVCDSSYVYSTIYTSAFSKGYEIDDSLIVDYKKDVLEITDSATYVKLYDRVFKYRKPSIDLLLRLQSDSASIRIDQYTEFDPEVLLGMKNFGDSAHYRILIYNDSTLQDSALLVLKKVKGCFKLTDVKKIL